MIHISAKYIFFASHSTHPTAMLFFQFCNIILCPSSDFTVVGIKCWSHIVYNLFVVKAWKEVERVHIKERKKTFTSLPLCSMDVIISSLKLSHSRKSTLLKGNLLPITLHCLSWLLLILLVNSQQLEAYPEALGAGKAHSVWWDLFFIPRYPVNKIKHLWVFYARHQKDLCLRVDWKGIICLCLQEPTFSRFALDIWLTVMLPCYLGSYNSWHPCNLLLTYKKYNNIQEKWLLNSHKLHNLASWLQNWYQQTQALWPRSFSVVWHGSFESIQLQSAFLCWSKVDTEPSIPLSTRLIHETKAPL